MRKDTFMILKWQKSCSARLDGKTSMGMELLRKKGKSEPKVLGDKWLFVNGFVGRRSLLRMPQGRWLRHLIDDH
jgi:hypothetical protein